MLKQAYKIDMSCQKTIHQKFNRHWAMNSPVDECPNRSVIH